MVYGYGVWLRPTFLYKLIYKPADCNFRKSGEKKKKNSIPTVIFLFFPPLIPIFILSFFDFNAIYNVSSGRIGPRFDL